MMHASADKTQENKGQSQANTPSPLQSSAESPLQLADNRPEAIAQKKMQEMADRSPRVSQLRAVQDMANKSREPPLSINHAQNSISTFSLAPIQAKFTGDLEGMTFENILESVATHLGATPAQIRSYVNQTGELTLQPYSTILAIANYVRPFWETDQAYRFLEEQGINGDVELIHSQLSSGNCHGYTFAAGGANTLDINTLDDLNEHWDGASPILICTTEDFIIHHSAKFEGGRYVQTLPGGPVFSSSRSVLEAQYARCYDLPSQLGLYTTERTAFLQEQETVERQKSSFYRLMDFIESTFGKKTEYWEATNLDPVEDWDKIQALLSKYKLDDSDA